MMTISELFAANEFSEKLSERVGKAWKRKREALAGGKRLTKKIPGWIDVESWKPISGRVATVKKIFSLYDSGHGISAIVKLLNGTQVPTWGGKREGKTSDWNASYVSQLLRSRTVIGEFQAHVTKTAETGNYYKRIQSGLPIEDYYPVIISKELFYRVQSKLGDAKAKTKSDKIGNLFSGVAFCKCGAKMYLVNSGKKNGLYYTCWNKVKGLKCDSPAVHYEPIETNFTRIFECDPYQLIEPDGDDSATTKADSLRAQLAEREKKIQNITEAVLGGAATKALIAKQGELESEVEAIKRELEIAQSKTSSCKTDAQQFEYIAKHIGQLRTNKDIRRKVRGWILANLKRMEFDSKKGRLNVQMKSGYNWPLRFFETKLIPSRLVVKTTEF